MTCLFLTNSKRHLSKTLKVDEDLLEKNLGKAIIDVEAYKFKLQSRHESMYKEFTVIDEILNPKPLLCA